MQRCLALMSLVLVMVATRLWAIDHGLPHTFQNDNHIAYHARLLRDRVRGPDPHNWDTQYPLLLPGLLAVLPSWEPAPESCATLDDHLHAASTLIVAMRIEVALLSVLLVPLTFLLARRFLSAQGSFFAAFLIASSLLLQTFGQQARPHAAAAPVFLLAVLASMRLARSPTWSSYVLASLSACLAIGVLQSGLAVLVPFSIAMLIGPFEACGPGARRWSRLAVAPVVLVSSVGASILAFYGPALRHGPGTSYGKLSIQGGALRMANHRLDPKDLDGTGFLTLLQTLWYYEPLLSILLVAALVALIVSLARARRLQAIRSDVWMAAAYAFAYVTVIGLFNKTYHRFAIPLLPFLAVFATWGLTRLTAWTKAAWRGAIVIGALLSLSIPVYAVGRLSWLRSREDTLQIAARWLTGQRHGGLGTVYIEPPLDLPLPRSAASLARGTVVTRWGEYQKSLPPGVLAPPLYDVEFITPRPDLGFGLDAIQRDPAGYVDALGTGWFVVDASRKPRSPTAQGVLDALRAKARLMHRCAPEQDGPTADWGLYDEDVLLPGLPNIFCRLLRASTLGPVVEIYKIGA